jgi:hypothetical protein
MPLKSIVMSIINPKEQCAVSESCQARSGFNITSTEFKGACSSCCSTKASTRVEPKEPNYKELQTTLAAPLEEEECPMCFEVLSDVMCCTLPCNHKFHIECVTELRKWNSICPMCRANLPATPEQLLAKTHEALCGLEKMVVGGNAAWSSLNPSQRHTLTEVRIMLAKFTGSVDQDGTLAAWFKKAGNQGFVDAQIPLAENCGVYKEQDSLIQKAADQVAQSFEESAQLIHQAADEGFVGVLMVLFLMYKNGIGVPQDNQKALQWIRKAAEQEDANAQFSLGRMYYKGQGVEQDDEVAARWLQKALYLHAFISLKAWNFMNAVVAYRLYLASKHSSVFSVRCHTSSLLRSNV